MKHLLLSPHNDDAVLFAAFTLLKYRDDIAVLTVFDSYVQGPHTKSERRLEDRQAIRDTLGVPVEFVGLRDDMGYTDQEVRDGIFSMFGTVVDLWPTTIWVPEAYDNGHAQHNQVSRAGELLAASNMIRYYHTYAREAEGKIQGLDTEHDQFARLRAGINLADVIEQKPEDLRHITLKLRALACYRTQIENNRLGCYPHFLRDQREWVRPA